MPRASSRYTRRRRKRGKKGSKTAKKNSENLLPGTSTQLDPYQDQPYDLRIRKKSPSPTDLSLPIVPNLRKKPRMIYPPPDIYSCPAAYYLQCAFPDELLLTIFSYLLEEDLCRLAQVCKRFRTIANDNVLWKRLYHSVFEYDNPLFNPGPCKFQFISCNDSEFANPWKESFRQLRKGVHVRPGQSSRYNAAGRSILHFETVQTALDHADENQSSPGPPIIVFLHKGTYKGEFLAIGSYVALIGAASGNVAESVIIERETESTVLFVEGAKSAYAGHLTLKFNSPDGPNAPLRNRHYSLEVGENCSPTLENCLIRCSSVGTYLSISVNFSFSHH